MRMLLRALSLVVLLVAGPALAQPTKMIIGTGVDPGFGVFYIAKEAGIFARNGLDVELKTGPSGSAMVGLLIGNQIQSAFGGEMAGIQSFNIDPNVVVAAEGSLLSRWFAVVGRNMTDLADLKGKRIGMPKGSSGELFWRVLLAQLGSKDADYDVVNVESPEIAAAMQRGNIDAAVTWEPWVSRIVENIPAAKVLKDSDGVFGARVYIYLNKKWAVQNQAAAASFMKSLLEANELIASDPAKGAAIIARYLNLDEKLTLSLMSKLRHDVRMDQGSIQNMIDAETQLKAMSKLSKPLDLSNFVYADVLRNVQPDKVDIKLP